MTVIVTLTGQAKFAAAAADGGAPIVLETLAIGDGGGSPITPLETATDLVNEVHSVSISAAEVDPTNPNWLVVTATIPSEAGPFTIREVGLFDEDGDLIAISDYPATLKAVTSMGVDTTLVIKMILVVSDTANVQVTLNNDGYATQEWVLAQIPEFASVPETVAGILETKKTHPKGVKAALDALRDELMGYINGLVVVTGNYNAKFGEYIWCDTSGGPITVTLPAHLTGPAAANMAPIAIVRWGANAVTVARNGEDIAGLAEDCTIDRDKRGVAARFVTTTYRLEPMRVA